MLLTTNIPSSYQSTHARQHVAAHTSLLTTHADWWHDHASGNHADGLAGLFIIDPEEGTPVRTAAPLT